MDTHLTPGLSRRGPRVRVASTPPVSKGLLLRKMQQTLFVLLLRNSTGFRRVRSVFISNSREGQSPRCPHVSSPFSYSVRACEPMLYYPPLAYHVSTFWQSRNERNTGRNKMSMLSASTINGTSVKSPRDESLGDIKDLMIDLTTGRVAYAVISFGGLLGIGNKLFAVPMQALKQDAVNKCFVMDTSKERLENANGFDSDNWPDFTDRTWQTEVHKHYNTPPYWG